MRLNVSEPISKGWSFEKEDGQVVSVLFKYKKFELCVMCVVLLDKKTFA